MRAASALGRSTRQPWVCAPACTAEVRCGASAGAPAQPALSSAGGAWPPAAQRLVVRQPQAAAYLAGTLVSCTPVLSPLVRAPRRIALALPAL